MGNLRQKYSDDEWEVMVEQAKVDVANYYSLTNILRAVNHFSEREITEKELVDFLNYKT